MLKRLLLICLAIFSIVAFMSCSSDDNPTESTNHAPSVPTINASAPSDGATEVALTAVMQWNCTDVDGDAITYTVYFGETTPPSAIPATQSTVSYDPGTLTYSTTYYWKISAEDSKGATSASDIWSFTTMDEPIPETVTVPVIPSGPTSGETSMLLSYSTGNAVSSYGHSVEYRFDWDGIYSTWSSSTSASYAWQTAGTYSVKAQARCVDHPTIESDWTAASTDVVITVAAETVSTPNAPSGPGTGERDRVLVYNVSGSVSSEGHTLAYRFDWGDGNTTLFRPNLSGTHDWSAAGSYDIIVQARCSTHPSIVSSWSSVTTVTITDPPVETISAPTLSGPSSGVTTLNQNFSVSGATSSEGHPLEYTYDWGDGTTSTSTGPRGHLFGTPGVYDVTVVANCQTHPEIVSPVSNTRTITITVP